MLTPTPYATVETKRKGPVEFVPHVLPEGSLPDVDAAGPGAVSLRDALLAHLAPLLPEPLLHLNLFASPSREDLRAFCYLKTRQFLALQLRSAEVARWASAFVAHFDGNPVELRFTATGASAGRDRDLDEELSANPIKQLKKRSPDAFNLAKLRKQKERHLAKLTERAEAAADPGTDPDQVQALLAQLVAARDVHPPPAAPAAWATLGAALAEAGVATPAALEALCRQLDGCPGLFFGYDLLGPARIEQEWRAALQVWNDWSLEDLQSTAAQHGVVQPLDCCPHWIPFVDLVSGNYLALDLVPAKKGHRGQVIQVGADVTEVRAVARDLTELLELCLAPGAPSGRLAEVFPQ